MKKEPEISENQFSAASIVVSLFALGLLLLAFVDSKEVEVER